MTSARKFVREAVRRLEIEDGDVIVIKQDAIPSGFDRNGIEAFLSSFSTVLGNTGRERCVVVVLEDLDAITALDTMQMMEYGWVRLNNS